MVVAIGAGAFALMAVVAAWGVTARPDETSRTPSPRLAQDPTGRLRAFDVRYRDLLRRHTDLVRRIVIHYRAWDGKERNAYVVLPRWYKPGSAPSLPSSSHPTAAASRQPTTSTSGATCPRTGRSS